MTFDDDPEPGLPRLAERIRERRPERKPRSPVAMIGVNIALLAILAAVVRYVIMPDLSRDAARPVAPAASATPDITDLVAIEDGVAVIRATGARIALIPPDGSARVVFVGDWTSALGKSDRASALDGISVLMSAVLGGRALDIVAIDAPSFTLGDVARLVEFSTRMRPSLVALVPAASAPDAPGADAVAALRVAIEHLTKQEIPVAVWSHAPNLPGAQEIAIEAGAAYFDEAVLDGANGATREAAAAQWLAQNL